MPKYTNATLIQPELIKIMSDEADIVEFAGMLEKVRTLADQSIDRRQIVLTDLVFWKNQLETQVKQLEIRIRKLDSLAYQTAYKSLALVARPTDAQVRAYIDTLDPKPEYVTYSEMLEVAKKWATILADLYFVSQSTHKILGNG